MKHSTLLLHLLGALCFDHVRPSRVSSDDVPSHTLDSFNVSSPARPPVLKPVCFHEDTHRDVELLPYNEEDCRRIISRQLMSDTDGRVKKRAYHSGRNLAPGQRRLPHLWEAMDCQFILTASPHQRELTVFYSDFDVALMAGKVLKGCGDTDIPLGGFMPHYGPRGEKMALVVERNVRRRDPSEAADGRSHHPAVARSFPNITTPSVSTDSFVGCLPPARAREFVVDIEECINLVHGLKSGPKSLGQAVYTNERHTSGRSVPYLWDGKECRIMIMSIDRKKPSSERFSEYVIAEQAAKIIRKCLLDSRGPATGGMVNMLPGPGQAASDFYLRLDSPHYHPDLGRGSNGSMRTVSTE